MDITLPYNFNIRDYQLDFFDAMNTKRRAVLVWHRRAGKDICAWNFMICKAVEHVGIYYYIFPTFAQGRKVLWDGITNDKRKFLDYIPKDLIDKTNSSEMKIRLINGSLIQIVGSDRYDALMGTNPTGAIFSEYSLQNPNAWEYIRPILDNPENNGWAVFVFTPRGSNHAKELYDKNLNNPDWFVQRLTVDDTKQLSKEYIKHLKEVEQISDDMIQQEYYCSFTLGIQGSYFAKYLEEAREEGRICKVPYDKHGRVNTSWDLGYGDSTSIIFFQMIKNEIHIIDFYENHGMELAHYAKILDDKPYLYHEHFVPHDVDKHELGTGLSVREIGRDLGLNLIKLPTLKVTHGYTIEIARGIFPRVWIDESKAAHLLKALENYRCEYDDKREIYKPRPVHDKWSHAADAFRYMTLAINKKIESNKGPSDDDVEKLMDKYNPRFS